MNKTAAILAEHVITLTIGGRTAYLADQGATWDGAWFTRDIGEAKSYKLRRNAERRILDQGSVWADLSPRVETRKLAAAA